MRKKPIDIPLARNDQRIQNHINPDAYYELTRYWFWL